MKYEIEKNKEVGNGLFGIDVSKIKELNGNMADCCDQIPKDHSFYLWNKNGGYKI